jgi:hypothetical protein
MLEGPVWPKTTLVLFKITRKQKSKDFWDGPPYGVPRNNPSNGKVFRSGDRLLASPLLGYDGRVLPIILSTIPADANNLNVAAIISALLSSQLRSTPAVVWLPSALFSTSTSVEA